MCGVAQHTEDTPGGAENAPTPINDTAALQNELVVQIGAKVLFFRPIFLFVNFFSKCKIFFFSFKFVTLKSLTHSLISFFFVCLGVICLM